MTEETEQPDQAEETETIAIPGAVVESLSRMMAGDAKSVNTSSLPQLTEFLDDHMKADLGGLTEPDTGVQAVVITTPEGVKPVPASLFDDYRETPKRRNGTAQTFDIESFIAHANRFKNENSVLFANPDVESPSLTAVLNYHDAGADSSPRFGDHRTSFRFPLSDEWKAWSEQDKNGMNMVQFAEFLEDNIVDVMPVEMVQFGEDEDEAKRFVEMLGGTRKIAEPAVLMQIAAGLQVNEYSNIAQASKLSSGEGKIDFKTTHETSDATGQSIVVPTLFAIGIPVFANGPAYRVLARLRYRKAGGSLTFYYELWRTDRVFKHAMDEAVALAHEETELPVLMGSPE